MMSTESTKARANPGAERRTFLRGGLAAAGGAGVAALGSPMLARAQETHSWRIQTHYSAGSPAGETFQRFIDNVNAMSDGRQSDMLCFVKAR